MFTNVNKVAASRKCVIIVGDVNSSDAGRIRSMCVRDVPERLPASHLPPCVICTTLLRHPHVHPATDGERAHLLYGRRPSSDPDRLIEHVRGVKLRYRVEVGGQSGRNNLPKYQSSFGKCGYKLHKIARIMLSSHTRQLDPILLWLWLLLLLLLLSILSTTHPPPNTRQHGIGQDWVKFCMLIKQQSIIFRSCSES